MIHGDLIYFHLNLWYSLDCLSWSFGSIASGKDSSDSALGESRIGQ